MIDHEQGTVKFPVMADVCASWEPGRDIISGSDPHGIEFTYRDSQPFEVEMYISGTDSNRWAFDRSIIFDGLQKAGQGGIADVQVYNDGEDFCYMRLESPHGMCVIRFRLAQMQQFAREMKTLVPIGEERVDMDLVIAKILARRTQ